jgi:hypothetical protein
MNNRSDLEKKIRELISGCPEEEREGKCAFIICGCDQQVTDAMTAIDEYTEAAVAEATGQPTGEAWDAQQCADYLGLLDTNAARSTLSRAGIKRIRQAADPETGRPMRSLYPAREVRALGVRREIRKAPHA